MQPTSERGFTLIEALVAMFIMTVALVSIAQLMAITLRMQMLGRNQTSEIRLAQSKVDELVAVDFDTSALVAVGGSVTTDVTTYNDTPVNGYKRRWAIAAIAGETRVRTLTVRVIPTNNDRRSNTPIELTTIIRDP